MKIETFVSNMMYALNSYADEVKQNLNMGLDHEADWPVWCELFVDIYLEKFRPLDDLK